MKIKYASWEIYLIKIITNCQFLMPVGIPNQSNIRFNQQNPNMCIADMRTCKTLFANTNQRNQENTHKNMIQGI
jgi:hypothetical protein